MTSYPCPVCGHNLAPRVIKLRDWLLHPLESRRRHRFDREYAVWHMLINHSATTTLHALSPDVAASWGPPQTPEDL